MCSFGSPWTHVPHAPEGSNQRLVLHSFLESYEVLDLVIHLHIGVRPEGINGDSQETCLRFERASEDLGVDGRRKSEQSRTARTSGLMVWAAAMMG